MRRTLALIVALTLLFVWSVPGTIALRHLLLALVLLLLTPELRRRPFAGIGANGLPLALLGLLSLWFVVQAVALSPEPAWALGELKGQWLPALLALFAGLLLAHACAGRESRLLGGISLVLTLQALTAVVHSSYHWLTTGTFLREIVPITGGKLELSFVVNLLLAFLVADLLARATRRDRLLPCPLAVNLLGLAIALVALYLAGARNGIIAVGLLGLGATVFYVVDQRRQIGRLRALAGGLSCLLLVASLAYTSVRSDPRWDVFLETAQIAWDVDHHDTWQGMERPLPTLASGEPADHSAYMRISWLHVGSRLIAEHPVGVGYGRNAFAHALRTQMPVELGHSHSGWIDLGVGGGVPALSLWAAFIASLVWLGWRALQDRARLAGLPLIFVALGFASRMLIDSVNKDHMLQIFCFVVGVLLLQLVRTPSTLSLPPR